MRRVSTRSRPREPREVAAAADDGRERRLRARDHGHGRREVAQRVERGDLVGAPVNARLQSRHTPPRAEAQRETTTGEETGSHSRSAHPYGLGALDTQGKARKETDEAHEIVRAR